MNTLENNYGLRFLDFVRMEEAEIHKYMPLAGSFAIIGCEERFLICFNRGRNQWELPAGKREHGETPKECAIRELYEETGQKVSNIEFKGLMIIRNTKTNELKYNPVYYTTIDELQPFMENHETTQIQLFSLLEEIEPIDPIDLKLLSYFNK